VLNARRFNSDIFILHGAKAKILSFCCLPIAIDAWLLDVFLISPHHRNFADIVIVTWKPTTLPYVKVNTDGSVIGDSAACGATFRDYRGSTVLCSLSSMLLGIVGSIFGSKGIPKVLWGVSGMLLWFLLFCTIGGTIV